MSDFVEQCRQEWRRLGVPDPLAEEMAADLASDLRDAEAEGVSAEELLGGSVSDPRGFAAAWATERGIVPERARRRRRPLALALFAAIAASALVGSAVLLLTGEPRVAAGPSGPYLSSPPTTITFTSGAGGAVHVVSTSAAGPVVGTSPAAPVEWSLLALALVALGFAAWLWSSWGRARPRLSSS